MLNNYNEIAVQFVCEKDCSDVCKMKRIIIKVFDKSKLMLIGELCPFIPAAEAIYHVCWPYLASFTNKKKIKP
jgi:6-pyruvoyl-tetrahydropterin synthase